MRNLLLLLAFMPTAASAAVGPQINGNQINPQTAISIATMSVTGAAGLSVTGPATASSGSFTATGNSQYSVVTSSGINVLAGGVWAAFMNATTFIGNLVGNVTGNVTGNATSATNLAAGGAGQIPYQTGSGATAFLPAMSAGGYIAGNGVAPPSTGTLSGTANQIIFTRTGANTVLSTPQDIGTGSSPTFATLSVTSVTTSGTGASSPFTITSSSGIRMNSGAFSVGTGGFIRWADGTTSTTAANGGPSTMLASSSTVLSADYNFSATACGVCMPGSTVTITMNGTNYIKVTFSGTATNSSGFANYLVPIVNGAIMAPYGCTVGNSAAVQNSLSGAQTQITLPGLDSTVTYSGTVSFCVSPVAGGGTSSMSCASNGKCKVRVEEFIHN